MKHLLTIYFSSHHTMKAPRRYGALFFFLKQQLPRKINMNSFGVFIYCTTVAENRGPRQYCIIGPRTIEPAKVFSLVSLLV